MNLSLSTGKRDHYAVLHELADAAYFRNMMLVCAVNNAQGPSYLSQYSSVFSVAAHECSDPFGFDYNPTPRVEFGASGCNVEVAWLRRSTIRVTGNSFAAAHLAGLVTRILSEHPVLTPFEVKTILRAIADNASEAAGR